jgi:hypothetical protein
MKTPHWTERRRDYLANKGKAPAKVINIADGFLIRTARVTADDILEGVRCTNEFLAEEIRQKKGGRGNHQSKAGAAEATSAPVQLEFPADGAA